MSRFAVGRSLAAPLALALASLLPVSAASPAHAAPFSWASGVSGSASDPARWSPTGVPDSASALTFNVAGTYTVTFDGTVPKTLSQTFKTGLVTLASPLPHAVHSLGVDGGHVWIEGSTFTGRFAEGTYVSLPSGMLTLNNGAHFSGGGVIAGVNPAELGVARGSHLHLGQSFEVRRYGTVNAWGAHPVTGEFSGIDGGPFGVTVGGTLAAHQGGYVDVLGPVYITGGQSGVVQSAHIGPGVPEGDSYLATQSDLIVGKNTGTQGVQLFGIAELNVKDRAWAHVGGMTVVGDSIGDQGCAIRLFEGGRFIANGGLKVFTTVSAGLDLRGGTAHVRGGQFTWPANKLLTVSSHTGSPELVIGTGTANPALSSGSPLVTALAVGRGGSGKVRVVRPGTVWPVNGSVSLADSIGGSGTLEADSSASLSISGPLSIGSHGTAFTRVRHGAQMSAGVTSLGAGATGTGRLDVVGQGSSFVAKDNLNVGGGILGDAGAGLLVVDSSATVSVVPTGVNPASVTVHPSAGMLVIMNGGTLMTGTLGVNGKAMLAGGAVTGLSTSVGTSGRVSGWGSFTGNFYSSGTLDPDPSYGNFGRFDIAGNFRQFSPGRYQVQLGAEAGVLRSDTLAVSGEANLDGTLEITLDASWQVQPLDTFTVLTCGSRVGTFSAVTWNGEPLAGQVQVLYEPNAVKLVVSSFPLSVDPEADGRAVRFAPVGGRQHLAFELELAAAAEVTVAMYDVTGRQVATLADGALAAGRHTLAVPSRQELPSGVYFARALVHAGDRTLERTVKAALLR